MGNFFVIGELRKGLKLLSNTAHKRLQIINRYDEHNCHQLVLCISNFTVVCDWFTYWWV